jgi:pimeloyl-ACP methyl ester carboxylesterase
MLPRRDESPGIVEHRVPTRDGLSLYCREYRPLRPTSAPTVLCLPGLTRNSRDFTSLAEWLAASHRVLTPDLRGRGRSDHDPNWRNYQPMTYVGDIAALLTALAAPNVVVIGTSLGGLLAMMMAAMLPGVLAGVVLNDIGPEVDKSGTDRIASYVGKLPPIVTWQDAASQSRLIHAAALPDFMEEDWLKFARCTYRDDGAGRPVLDMDPHIGDAMRDAAGPLPDLWPLFRLLGKVPTLAIRGATSDILSPATFARMQQEKPDLQRLTVPNRGHAPTLDEPMCRSAIRALLDLSS